MTISKYDEDLSGPILACAVYAIQNARAARNPKKGGHFNILKENLSSALNGIASLQQSSSPGWRADTDNPGFLIKQTGPVFIRVPAHLVQLFPDRGALNKIWELGAQIKTSADSILHISGSNATKEVFSYINDIDFCEYTVDKPSKIAKSIIDIVSSSIHSVCCIKVRIADEEFLSPFSQDDIRSGALTLSYQEAERSSFKMDYLVNPDWSERPYEISNVGITCKYSDGKFHSAGFGKTFAYQQAQIAATDLVPTSLDDPEEAGRYALWLMREIKKYKASNDELKMLKRLLSLVRFCYLRDLTEKFDYLFENATMLVKAELKEVDRLLLVIQASTQQHCVNAFDTPVVNMLESYRTDLLLQLQRSELKEQKCFPNGVTPAVDELFNITAERVRLESMGSVIL